MNQYGAMARRHWRMYLPDRYQKIADPEVFFTEMGEQISEQVHQIAAAIAGQDPQQETFMGKLGRLNMARLNVEEQVLREMLPDPETEVPQREREEPEPVAGR